MNEEYIDNVKHLIEQKDADKVKELLVDLHPADIAELCDDLNPEEARFVYRLLNNETAADVLVEMDEDGRGRPPSPGSRACRTGARWRGPPGPGPRGTGATGSCPWSSWSPG